MIVVLSLIALRTWTWTSRLMLIAKEISLITRLHLVFLFFRVTHLSLTWRSKKQSIIYLLHFWSWILHYGSGYYWNSLASMASIGLWAFLLSLPHFFIVIIRVSFRSPTTLFFMCTKNIEVDCHFVRQHLQSCTIDRLFVSFSRCSWLIFFYQDSHHCLLLFPPWQTCNDLCSHILSLRGQGCL